MIGTEARPGVLGALQLIDAPAALFGRPLDRRWGTYGNLLTALMIVAGGSLQAPAVLHALVGTSSALELPGWIAFAMPFLQVVTAALGLGLFFGLSLLWRAVARLSGTVGQYWLAACAIATLAFGFEALVAGGVAMLAGVDRFSSMDDVARLIPNAGMLVPTSLSKMHGVLAVFDPFRIWTCALFAVAFRKVGRASIVASVIGAFVVTMLPPILCAALK